ncbi:hypothetical protein H072_9770 [Dactylellina haptotyla CBS 200.50]|uniref:Uncharacterized protein n=1 Tax=Dactylellina haptotyla (strain CBS 200.50) TaxID=1284197 RepID=S8BBW8_DACHA|nr:hypothetical protein H072_9770 [Dactylellina haptotyla CBS 200.50]
MELVNDLAKIPFVKFDIERLLKDFAGYSFKEDLAKVLLGSVMRSALNVIRPLSNSLTGESEVLWSLQGLFMQPESFQRLVQNADTVFLQSEDIARRWKEIVFDGEMVAYESER